MPGPPASRGAPRGSWLIPLPQSASTLVASPLIAPLLPARPGPPPGPSSPRTTLRVPCPPIPALFLRLCLDLQAAEGVGYDRACTHQTTGIVWLCTHTHTHTHTREISTHEQEAKHSPRIPLKDIHIKQGNTHTHLGKTKRHKYKPPKGSTHTLQQVLPPLQPVFQLPPPLCFRAPPCFLTPQSG